MHLKVSNRIVLDHVQHCSTAPHRYAHCHEKAFSDSVSKKTLKRAAVERSQDDIDDGLPDDKRARTMDASNEPTLDDGNVLVPQ